MFVLRLQQSDSTVDFQLDGNAVRIGRDDSCEITLADPRCSRVHCVVEQSGAHYRVVDPGSRNGTRVNDVLVHQKRLAPGDVIRVGSTTIRFERAIARAVTPPDATSASRSAMRRCDRHAGPNGSSSRRFAIGTAAVLLIAVAAFVLTSGNGDEATRDDSSVAARNATDRASETPMGGATEWNGRLLQDRQEDARTGGASGQESRSDRHAGAADARRASNGSRRIDPGRQRTAPEAHQTESGSADGAPYNQRPSALVEDHATDRPQAGMSAGSPRGPGRQSSNLEPDPTGSTRIARTGRAHDEETPPAERTAAALSERDVVLLLQDVFRQAQAHAYDRALAVIDEGLRLASDERLLETLNHRRDDILARRRLFDVLLAQLGTDPEDAGMKVAGSRVIGATATDVIVAGNARISWASLAAADFLKICERVQLDAPARLGLAVFLFDEGEEDAAHRALERLVLDEPDSREAINMLLARKLGISVPPGPGFLVWNHRWVTPLKYDQEMRGSHFHELRAKIIGGTADDRLFAYSELVAMGEPGIRALREDLPRCRDDIHMELRGTSTYKKLAELHARRVELQGLRDAILARVFDLEQYPKDFKPPKASQQVYATYRKTQAWIDMKTRDLEELWSNARRQRVRFPAGFEKDLRQLQACVRWFDDVRLDRPSIGESDFLEWIPAGWIEVNLQNFPATPADVTQWNDSVAALAANRSYKGAAGQDEVTMVAISNKYRMMMGRTALRIHDGLVEAAQQHSEEMSILGYFAHSSPVEKYRTPDRRTRLFGFPGHHVGENIARGYTDALATHEAWCDSPPHHRNILKEAWTHVGQGRSGKHWTSNFGEL